MICRCAWLARSLTDWKRNNGEVIPSSWRVRKNIRKSLAAWDSCCIFAAPDPPSLSTMLKSGVVLFLYPMENQGEIILYQPDNEVKLEVRLEEETVWLTQAQMAELFQTSKQNVSLHTNNIFKEKELSPDSVVKDSLTTAADGKKYRVKYYNLDVIISVGYRVKSIRGTQFRQWANKVLKEYLLKGYSVNQHLSNLEDRMNSKFMEHEQRMNRIDSKIDFFVRTSLPPVEGIFYDGQLFDAYKFATDLICSARVSLLLIDNYVDESVLLMLSKRNAGVPLTCKKTDRCDMLVMSDSRIHGKYKL